MFKKFGDQDDSKLFKENNKERKIKEIMFKIFIFNLPRLPSNGHFFVIVISLSLQNKINKRKVKRNYQVIATGYNYLLFM